MQASQRFGQALIVARQTPKTGRPGETPRNDPAPRQQYKTAPGGR